MSTMTPNLMDDVNERARKRQARVAYFAAKRLAQCERVGHDVDHINGADRCLRCGKEL